MSRQRQKGTAGETACVNTAREEGFPYAERRALHGMLDKGDLLWGDPSISTEVKVCKEIRLAEFLDEALAERDNAGAAIGFVWAKRRGKTDPRDWYCVTDGRTMLKLLRSWCGK